VSNVLVVGSGAAGVRAAIAVHAAGREVVIVGKRLRKDAIQSWRQLHGSEFRQRGIAKVVSLEGRLRE
jgi:aspartate oxidase